MRNIDKLREMLKEKENNVNTKEDIERVNALKELFLHDDIFFKIDVEFAYSILEFLGIPDDLIEDFYLELISFGEYSKNPKQYITISNEK